MKLKKEFWILATFFAVTLAMRLLFAFQTPEFSADEAYYTLRQIEHIKETGLPIFYDELSYGGKDQIVLPGYYYIMAFFNMFLPLWFVVKVIPNIFASLLIPVVYILSLEITKKKNAALAAAFVSAFIPIFFVKTANTLSVYSIVVPLLFMLIYYFIRLEEGEQHLYPFLLIFVFLSFIHTSLIILVFGLLLYLLLRLIEKLKINTAEIELTLFSTFLVLWFMFLFYKKALLSHGLLIIKENIPQAIIAGQFAGFNIISSLYAVGFVPLLAGVYAVYRHLQKERRKPIILFIGLTLAVVILLVTGLIRLHTGLLFFGAMLAVMFGLFYSLLVDFLERSKFSNYKHAIIAVVFLVFILTSVVSSLIQLNTSILNAPSKEKVSAMKWIEKNTDTDAIVLASLDEGSMLAYYANRKNVIDSNFLLVDDASQRLEDVKTLFTIPYKTNAINLLNQYDIDYIFLSQLSKDKYAIDSLRYASEGDECFKNVFQNSEAQIIQSMCMMEESTT